MPCHDRSRGQAVIEGVVGLSLLVVLFWAVPWVGRYLELVDLLQHASRHAAFSEASQADVWAEAGPSTLPGAWFESGHRWRRPNGSAVVNKHRAELGRHTVSLDHSAQPGQSGAYLPRIREDWGLADRGMPRWTAVAEVAWLAADSHPVGTLRLSRQTTLARHAGHSRDDNETTARLHRGGLAWANAAAKSRRVGESIAAQAGPLEGGWSRPLPNFDWLAPWQGLRPHRELGDGGAKP